MAGGTEPAVGTRPVVQRLIITRPADEAQHWVHRLQAAGWPTVALPLIRLLPPRDPATLAALRHQQAQWAAYDALMFVSGAAVRHFFASSTLPLAAVGSHTRCWAPGPGTAQALRAPLAALGLGPQQIDVTPADAVQFDSESLWPVVASQVRPGSRILIVRGASMADSADAASAEGSGREWLIQRCEQAGATVQTVAAYERHPPVWTAEEQALARLGQSLGSLWLFSSSEALAHLLAGQPQANWSQAVALATHPRIAQRVLDAGFGQVLSTRPAFDDVLCALESARCRS